MKRSDKKLEIAIFSPHPDDAAIGAGGFLNRTSQRNDLHITLVQVGFSKDSVRGQQELAYCEKRGFSSVFLSLGDESEPYVHRIKTAAVRERALSILGFADLVLAPHAQESHPDHVAVARAVSSAHSPVAYYEIWAPLGLPNKGYVYPMACVALSPEEQQCKLAGITEFGSVSEQRFFAQMVHNLTNYRWVSIQMHALATNQSGLLPPKCRHVETYRFTRRPCDRIRDLFDIVFP